MGDMEAEILKPNLAGMPVDGEAGSARLPRRCGRGQQIPFWHCLCGPAPGVLRPAHHMQRYTSSCGRAPDCRASTAICRRPDTSRSWGCAISGLLRRPCRHPRRVALLLPLFGFGRRHTSGGEPIRDLCPVGHQPLPARRLHASNHPATCLQLRAFAIGVFTYGQRVS